MTLYILNYNNYYNRILKKEDTLEDYIKNRLVYSLLSTNFNPNDNVYTEHIIGVGDYDGKGDYLVVANEYNEILSRWFILEVVRTRAGQYKLELYRDTLVDYYNQIIQSPVFIEKATLNSGDPLAFNTEDMTFNQIKQSEVLLKDKTKCAWIVGYYAKNTSAEHLKGTIAINPLNDVYDILIDTTFENWEYNATENPIKTNINAIDYRIYANNISGHPSSLINNLDGYVSFSNAGDYLGFNTPNAAGNYSLDFKLKTNKITSALSTQIASQASTLFSQAKTYLSKTLTAAEASEFLSLNGKIIKDINGKYYQVSLYQEALIYETKDVSAGSLFNSLKSIVSSVSEIEGTPNADSFKVYASFVNYKMVASELEGLESSWDLSGNKLLTTDAPYNIFAIPYGDCKLLLNNLWEFTSREEYALPLAESIIRELSSSLYDIQLLPYCPIEDIVNEGVNVKSAEGYSIVRDKNDNPLTFILNVPFSRFSRNISYEIKAPETIIDLKISNECDKYRLASPNFNGYFDFSVAKNGGVEYFNVDCTLKPFQPYIHINPNFDNLYGRDFNDPRGLICGGDFSLSQYIDKWQEYQLQNKNYQEMFDRQIQNMEINNKAQKTQDIINAITGTATGAVSGAATGAMMSGGNPYAAAAGAIVGGVSSAIGGIADISINEKLRNEALDYTKDNFGYQLGNIQALPYTLTKVSSLNNNNKIFPVLEYYTCTRPEKDAFANKLAYNGMTVMAIGIIFSYLGNNWSYGTIKSKGYIKGQLIRLEGLEEDFHVIKTISKELNMGVYIQ